MYKCRDCEAIFETPKRVNADSYNGVADLFPGHPSPTYYDVCPQCEGSIEEAKECGCCGEYFFPDELQDTTEMINGGCGDCCEGCIENGDMIEIGG